MSLSQFFTTVFAVKRMSWSNESASEISKTNVSGHLQQAKAEDTENLKLSFTKTFSIWCAVDADVMEGDTMESGGKTYTVRAVKVLNYGGNQHKQLIAERNEQS